MTTKPSPDPSSAFQLFDPAAALENELREPLRSSLEAVAQEFSQARCCGCGIQPAGPGAIGMMAPGRLIDSLLRLGFGGVVFCSVCRGELELREQRELALEYLEHLVAGKGGFF